MRGYVDVGCLDVDVGCLDVDVYMNVDLGMNMDLLDMDVSFSLQAHDDASMLSSATMCSATCIDPTQDLLQLRSLRELVLSDNTITELPEGLADAMPQLEVRNINWHTMGWLGCWAAGWV